jgi:hypothetical protein
LRDLLPHPEPGPATLRIVKDLCRTDFVLPRETLEWMRTHREEGARIAGAVIRTWLTDPVHQPDGCFGPVLSLFMLAEFRDPRAYPLLLAVAHHPRVEDVFGDSITEDVGRLAFSLWDGDLASVQRLAEDARADEWARAGGLHALLLLTLHGQIERASAIAYLREHLQARRMSRCAPIVRNELAQVALNLHPADLLDLLARAYNYGYIDPQYVAWNELVGAAKRSVADVMAESRAQNRGAVTDAIGEIEKWATYTEPRERAPEAKRLADTPRQPAEPDREAWGWKPTAPIRREGPDTGRNDPCPCGSGKKYKKCCMK